MVPSTIKAQYWTAMPPYNVLWPLWSSDPLPELSPIDPVTGMPTPLVSELTVSTILVIQPGLAWDPYRDDPWLLYNSPYGIMVYYDVSEGIKTWPPAYLLDPIKVTPSPIALPIGWSALAPILTTWLTTIIPLANEAYELYISTGPFYQGIYGWVRDRVTGEGIVGAEICCTIKIDQCKESKEEWWTNDSSYKIGLIEKGFFMIDPLFAGEGTLRVQASQYKPRAFKITVSPNTMKRVICYLERDPNFPFSEPDIDPNKLMINIDLLWKNYQDPNQDLNIEPLNVKLHNGLNLFSYPLDYPPYSAGDFLTTHDPDCNPNGPKWFSGMRCYDNSEGIEDTCYFVLSDQNTWSIESSDPANPGGFRIGAGEGYTLYMHQGKTISFSFPPPNSQIALKEGINWVGIPSPPPGYTSYIMLLEIGTPEEVLSISGYNPITGEWESTFWRFGRPGGENFPILSGQGYIVNMKKEKDWFPGEGF